MNTIFDSTLATDASYLIHRALHVKEIFDLRSPSGERTGGVFQFMRSLNSEMRKNPGYFPILCWDSGLSDRRLEADPCYKHADEKDTTPEVLTPEEMDNDYLTQYRKQRSMIMKLLSYAGIPSLRFPKWEGDDLVYIVTRISKKCRVMSDDRDMEQLLTETTTLRRPMHDETLTLDKFLSDNGYSDISDFVKNKSIVGDGSDNIPGSCKGVGGGNSFSLVKLARLTKGDPEVFSSEEKLRKICEENGLKFRKAFMNFDYKRYQTNLELIDLKRVEITDRILESIISEVSNCRSSVDYFALSRNLSDLGIKEVSPDEIISSVSERYKTLLL
jgi:5'-3' exonuclease